MNADTDELELRENDYTPEEQALVDSLPQPPAVGTIDTSNVWILEWLGEDELLSGTLLHQWMETERPGWSLHIACRNKDDVLAGIARAARFAREKNRSPILHIEAHGCEDARRGLVGPDGWGGNELLPWEELTQPLQILNTATGGNLAVCIASCTGFSGIVALTEGPRAPAILLIGPTHVLTAEDLLAGFQEVYRQLKGGNASARDMVDGASRQAAGLDFEFESFARLCYQSVLDELMRRLRRAKALSAGGNESEVKAQFPKAEVIQASWDYMFMMDIVPANRERFGVDMRAIHQAFLKDALSFSGPRDGQQG